MTQGLTFLILRTFLSAGASAHIIRGPVFGIDFYDLAGSIWVQGVAIAQPARRFCRNRFKRFL